MPRPRTDDGIGVRTGTAEEETVGPTQFVPDRNGVKTVAGWWALVFGACLVLYWPGLRGGYFSDDLLFFFNSPPAHLYDYFATRGAAAHAYRPLEAMILTVIQQRFWFNTLPIHLLSLAAHAGLVCAVLVAARRLRLNAAETLLAGAFMLTTQVGAPAVLGNDTLSQSASALLGGLSALFLCLAWIERRESSVRRISAKWIALSAGMYTIGLFFKETALGFLPVALILIAGIALADRKLGARLKTFLLLSVPYGSATLLYWMARLHAGGAIAESGSYRVHAGLNVFRNLAEFSLAAFGPVSTVDGAVAVALHRTPDLILEGLGWVLVVAVMVVGILVSRRSALCLGLMVLAVASLFPAYLLTHVSELYLYNAIPFLSLVFGIASGSLWSCGRRGKVATVVSAGLLMVGEVYADRQKAELMAMNGRNAGMIYAGLQPYLQTLPRDGAIILVNPPNRVPEYSVFLLKGFDVVDLGNLRIGPIFGRPDVRVEVVDETQIGELRPGGNRLLLGMDPLSGVRPYQGPGSQ